jgi:hypothetical protein
MEMHPSPVLFRMIMVWIGLSSGVPLDRRQPGFDEELRILP